jgi:hypothetical protein
MTASQLPPGGEIAANDTASLPPPANPRSHEAARNLGFEKAALLRARVLELRRKLVRDEEGLNIIYAMRRSGSSSYGRGRRRR